MRIRQRIHHVSQVSVAELAAVVVDSGGIGCRGGWEAVWK